MSLTLSAALTALPTPLRAVVVGGTGGIGLAIAKHLSTLPSSEITISGRKPPADQPVPSNMTFKKLDASSMREIKTYCAEIAKELEAGKEKLDMLVVTQGILTMQGRTPTPEGIDVKMALHYYSRFLIIRELLPSLSPTAVVITVLDAKRGDPSGKSIKWDNLDLSKPGSYGVAAAADHCITFSDVMVQDLSLTHPSPGRTFIHAYPGFVDTGLLSKNSNFSAPVRIAGGFLSKLMAVKPDFAGEKILVGAVEAWKQGKGWAYVDDKGREIKKAESPEEVRRKLREHTWGLVDEAAAGGVAEMKGKVAA